MKAEVKYISAVGGLEYDNPEEAGDIRGIIVDGVKYKVIMKGEALLTEEAIERINAFLVFS